MNQKKNKNIWLQFIILPVIFAMLNGLIFFMLLPAFENGANSKITQLNSNQAEIQTVRELTSLLNRQEIVVEPPAPLSVNLDELGRPVQGTTMGTVAIDGTTVLCDLYYGDGNYELNNGAGLYAGAHIPGGGGTILVAGHTGTYFSDFKNAQLGQNIQVETYYGTYVYEIVDMKVVEASDTTTYDLESTEENIILYTCYPFGILEPTPYRYFIYGKFVSGPVIE